MVAEDGSTDISKEGIIMQNIEEENEVKKEKNQSPPNGTNIRNPSLSRQFSFKQLGRGVSLSRSQSRSVSRPSLQNETDLENGGS